MGEAIGHGFRNLMNFQGRDRRKTFWLYMLFICLMWVLLSTIGSIYWVASIVQTITQSNAMQTSNPDEAVGVMMSTIFGQMGPVMWGSAILSAIIGLFTIASFVRRLHDSDLSGWWALLPYGMLLLTFALLPLQMSYMNEMMAAMPDFMAQAANNPSMNQQYPGQTQMTLLGIPGWVQFISFIILAVRDSTRGPNRFGDEPPIRY